MEWDFFSDLEIRTIKVNIKPSVRYVIMCLKWESHSREKRLFTECRKSHQSKRLEKSYIIRFSSITIAQIVYNILLHTATALYEFIFFCVALSQCFVSVSRLAANTFIIIRFIYLVFIGVFFTWIYCSEIFFSLIYFGLRSAT